MREQPGSDDASTAGEDLQLLDNVLRATGASDVSRRGLLRSAAVGTAALGALTVPGLAGAAGAAGESPREILSTLATAESFGVTFLTEAVSARPARPPPASSTRCAPPTQRNTTTSWRCAGSAAGRRR